MNTKSNGRFVGYRTVVQVCDHTDAAGYREICEWPALDDCLIEAHDFAARSTRLPYSSDGMLIKWSIAQALVLSPYSDIPHWRTIETIALSSNGKYIRHIVSDKSGIPFDLDTPDEEFGPQPYDGNGDITYPDGTEFVWTIQDFNANGLEGAPRELEVFDNLRDALDCIADINSMHFEYHVSLDGLSKVAWFDDLGFGFVHFIETKGKSFMDTTEDTLWRLVTSSAHYSHSSDGDTLDNTLDTLGAAKQCLENKGYSYDEEKAIYINPLTDKWITLSLVLAETPCDPQYDLWADDNYVAPPVEIINGQYETYEDYKVRCATRAELSDAQVAELTIQLEQFTDIVDSANNRGDLATCCLYAGFVLAIAALLS